MKTKKYKMLTALVLAFILAFTPMSLFASPSEGANVPFKTQLVQLLGEEYAGWFIEDLEWLSEFADFEGVVLEILALDLMAFLAEHMTADELETFLDQDYIDIYWDLWDLIDEVFIDPTWAWDDDWTWTPTLSAIWEEEGAALFAQLVEIVGESHAAWIAEELEWYREILGEETFAIILGMDVMTFLAAYHLTGEEIEAFWEMDYVDRYLILLDAIEETFIWPALDDWDWGVDDWSWSENVVEISREEIVNALELLIYEYLTYDDFDFIALLAVVDMTQDDFVDFIYSILSLEAINSSIWWWAMQDEDWLIGFLDDILFDIYRSDEAEAIMELHMMFGVMLIFDILGNDSWNFLDLRVFDQLVDIFGDDTFGYAMSTSPYLEDILRTYGADLLTYLDFDLYDALSVHFGEEEGLYGFSVLNYIVGGLLMDNMDMLYELYTAGPPTPPEPRPQFWRMVYDWEYIILEPEDLEYRFSFSPAGGTEFVIDFLDIEDDEANLNLFFRSYADYYTFFVIETWGSAGDIDHVFEVSPHGAAVIQLSADLLRGGSSMVWIMVVNMDGDEVAGEFAFRKTHLPLGYER